MAVKWLGYYLPKGRAHPPPLYNRPGSLGIVSKYTNLCHLFGRFQFSIKNASQATPEEDLAWRTAMGKVAAKGVAKGMKLYVNLNGQVPIDITGANIEAYLKVIAPYWDDEVVVVELADEPKWTRQEAKANIKKYRAIEAKLGLAPKQIGCTWTTDQSLNENVITIPDWDFANLECYIPAPGNANPEVDIRKLQDIINRARNRPGVNTKRIWLTAQGFCRNGKTPVARVVPLQMECYRLAAASPRTDGILIFSYGRKDGTWEHPELEAEHRKISKKMGLTA